MSKQSIELLAFSPHPDDAEIFCGGLLLKSARLGRKTGIIDLTRGELSSQGTAEQRRDEIARASKVLELALRETLSLPDGALYEDSREEQVRELVGVIRKRRPQVVLAPYWRERHPDHEGASRLVSRAVFLAALRKFEPELGASHSTAQIVYYPMRQECRPSFVCDVSEVHDKKMEAIEIYQSQVVREKADDPSKPGTLISSPLSLSSMTARSAYYGAMIGKAFAEPYLVRNVLSILDPATFFTSAPGRDSLFYPTEQ